MRLDLMTPFGSSGSTQKKQSFDSFAVKASYVIIEKFWLLLIMYILGHRTERCNSVEVRSQEAHEHDHPAVNPVGLGVQLPRYTSSEKILE
jgi:hypothetical protein